jgi:hypothetical protein
MASTTTAAKTSGRLAHSHISAITASMILEISSFHTETP